jgi:TPR repeat protein
MMGDIEENRSESANWYLMAANQGDAAAQAKMCYCYMYGEGVANDDAAAEDWCRKALMQGNGFARSLGRILGKKLGRRISAA